MRHTFLLFALVVVSPFTVAVGDESDFQSIFDGKTLKGWEGNLDFWSVQDGAITGQTTPEKKLSKNTFLIWKGETADFELRLKFRIENGNSGIQYRSEHQGDYVVKGYQADIDAKMRFMGILYEERGRGILAERGNKVEISASGEKKTVGKAGDGQALLDSYKNEDWNDYVIIAKGNMLTQKINGHTSIVVVDHQKDKRAMKGILALQAHVGPPMIVQFKDIQIKHLSQVK
ncbi:MAG: DUF1080 domain-containing protein [Pirellulaceae bacterium]|nr:DUF1080 domain-containing protein [Planctomycetaceae bacterium]